MKNPIKPNLKTEWYPILAVLLSCLAASYFKQMSPDYLAVSFSRDGQIKFISWSLLAYFWPLTISLVYSMFLFFPYFKINHLESSALKDYWHKTKELSLSFLFCLQVVGAVILLDGNKTLLFALPVLFVLLLVSFVPSIVKILSYRKKILLN